MVDISAAAPLTARKDIFIFLGPPGSGKGSLSQLCMKRLGWKQLSTGNLCREHIARQTEIGKQIDFAIKSGKLIADSLIIDMASDWLKNTFEDAGIVIIDGFPRTVPQAQALHDMIKSLDDITMNVVLMEIPLEAVVDRLLSRSICQNNKCQRVYSVHAQSSHQSKKHMICDECESPLVRRPDDEQNAIHERLKVYKSHEQALREFYESVGQSIYMIRADEPLETVYERLLELIGHASI